MTKPSNPQNDTSDQELEDKMKRLYKENPPLNDTSELRELKAAIHRRLENGLPVGFLSDIKHWDFFSRAEDDVMKLIDNYAAQREQAARIDELRQVRKESETGDFSIWVNKWAKRRIAELRATKPEKGAL